MVQWHLGTQIKDSEEWTPFLGPSQGCLSPHVPGVKPILGRLSIQAQLLEVPSVYAYVLPTSGPLSGSAREGSRIEAVGTVCVLVSAPCVCVDLCGSHVCIYVYVVYVCLCV